MWDGSFISQNFLFCIVLPLELALLAAPWCRGTGDSKCADVPLGGSVRVLDFYKLHIDFFALLVYSGIMEFFAEVIAIQKHISCIIGYKSYSLYGGRYAHATRTSGFKRLYRCRN